MNFKKPPGVRTVPVSVIIPCYNCADTIQRAADSVISQTCQPAELIMVDDASEDLTLQKLLEIKKNYKEWTKVIALDRNLGPSIARNRAWNAATQEYIAFLDADDSWHPRKIEIQYSWMAQHPKVVLTGHGSVWIKKSVCGQLPHKWHPCQVKPFNLLISNKFLTRSVMLRRDVRFRFNTDKRFSEDYLLWLEIVLNGYMAWYMDLPLAYSYKAPFGEAGLSQNLLKMEKGELDTYHRLYRKGLLSFFSTCCLTVFSLAKYLRRLIISKIFCRFPDNYL